MLIGNIFGFDVPPEGGFDLFGISVSGHSMFEEPGGNAADNDSDSFPPF
jgi:hypothetical protein